MNAFFAPSPDEVTACMREFDAPADVCALVPMCSHTPQITFQHLAERSAALLHVLKSGQLDHHTELLHGLQHLYVHCSRLALCAKDDATNAERKWVLTTGGTARHAVTYTCEFAWLVLARAVRTMVAEENAVSTLEDCDDARRFFAERIVRYLTPARWWNWVTQLSADDMRWFLCESYDLTQRMLDPSFNVGISRPDAEVFRLISLCERLSYSALFAQLVLPIETMHDSERHHAAGKFVEPRFARDPARRRYIRDVLDQYIRNTQHANFPVAVADRVLARSVLFGEHAAFQREQPDDARIYKAKTTLKRCLYAPDYCNKITDLSAQIQNGNTHEERFSRWRDEIDMCAYGMLFTERCPQPVTLGVRRATAGRTGVSEYVDCFARDYMLHWYQWLSVSHMLNAWQHVRHDRKTLPFIFDVGCGYLIRDGPPLDSVSALQASLGLNKLPRQSSADTEWVFVPTAIEALVEWEYRAQERHQGDLERPAKLPRIARTAQDCLLSSVPVAEAPAPPPDTPPPPQEEPELLLEPFDDAELF